MLAPVLRRTYDPGTLLRDHPPKLKHPHKRLVLELACPPGARHAGSIELTRWPAAPLPACCELAATEVIAERGHYVYDGADGVWHVNFADPQLFVAYGTPLLAQDELQAVEHPLMGSLREALLAEGQPAITETDGVPTPVLVTGLERRIELQTAPDLAASRPLGLYGNQFARAEASAIRRAVRVIDPPTHTNLIAIAAPVGRGPYLRAQLERILTAAYTGFAAARAESRRLWPEQRVEIRTGFWGCGAFGGNRHAMTLSQLLAARLAGIDRVRFYAFDDKGRAAFDVGAADLQRVLAAQSEPLACVLDRILALGYAWGVGDGT